MSVRDKLRARARGLKSDIAALYIAFRRKDTPLPAKIIIWIAVCYAFSPVDLIPDFIPVIGFLDDVLLLPLLAAFAIKLIPPRILDESRGQAEEIFKDGGPKSLICALPVLAVWAVIVGLILSWM